MLLELTTQSWIIGYVRGIFGKFRYLKLVGGFLIDCPLLASFCLSVVVPLIAQSQRGCGHVNCWLSRGHMGVRAD